MQHERKQNKPNKRRGARPHGGAASVTARACKVLLNPRADAGLSARLVGAVGVAERRVTARGLPRADAWCAPVIINRCTSLLAPRFAPGSAIASRRSENEYGAPSQLPPDVAADAAHPGDGLRSLAPGEGKGRPGACPKFNQLPRCGPAPPAARRKFRCAASTYPALWIGTGLANPLASRAYGRPSSATRGPADPTRTRSYSWHSTH
jgi:hypothetical protein